MLRAALAERARAGCGRECLGASTACRGTLDLGALATAANLDRGRTRHRREHRLGRIHGRLEREPGADALVVLSGGPASPPSPAERSAGVRARRPQHHGEESVQARSRLSQRLSDFLFVSAVTWRRHSVRGAALETRSRSECCGWSRMGPKEPPMPFSQPSAPGPAAAPAPTSGDERADRHRVVPVDRRVSRDEPARHRLRPDVSSAASGDRESSGGRIKVGRQSRPAPGTGNVAVRCRTSTRFEKGATRALRQERVGISGNRLIRPTSWTRRRARRRRRRLRVAPPVPRLRGA